MKWLKHQRILWYLLWIFPFIAHGQQVPQYSHYLLNGMLVNPAYAGYREHWYGQLFYHNQWVRTGTPQYFAFAVDGKIKKGVNLGIQYSNEQIGAASVNAFSAAYAYRLQITGRSDLSFGLGLGVSGYGINFSKLRPFEENDPLLASLANQWLPLVDAGVYYGSDRFFAGVAVRNIANGRRWNDLSHAATTGDFLIPPATWYSVWTFGLSLPVSATVEWRPSVMWQEDFETPSHVDITTALLFHDRYWIGVSFRADHHFWKPRMPNAVNEFYSLALTAEIFITDRITFSYAYDLGLQSFSTPYRGGHEWSIGYYFTRKLDSRFNRKLRYKKYTTNEICYCP
ncbi:MAG: PorP/SprF family type IX secretion system membrane protein [Prevotellaceae bacterium]|jgi:type IX secretion system PorP/SprF family membrane protein|nr:PorP/SprF family type IX secretion system membrane protein [Prevotellaceae bacterium]